MAFLRIPRRWRLRTLMIIVALCAVGLVIYRINLERAPIYRLIRQLRTGNAQARSQAAVQLGLMGPKAAFAEWALTSALDDPDPGVRTEAAFALVAIGSRSPRLVRALVAELEKPPPRSSPVIMPWNPGHDPVAALKTIRPDAAVIVPMLDRALRSPTPSVRRRAIDVLCAAAGWSDPASPEVAEPLLALLADDRFETRKQVVDALAKMDRKVQERAVARLADDLRDLDSSRSFEASLLLPSLAGGTPTAVAMLMDQARGGDEVRRLIALFLLAQYGELATPAVPALLRIIAERDADRRINLGLRMYWWKSFGARGGESHFRRQFPDPNTPGETSVVALCVRALGAMGGAVEQRAVHELVAVVKDPDQDRDRKRCAIVALGEFGPGAVEAIPTLVDVIRARAGSSHREPHPDGDQDLSLGALATEALEKIGSEGNEEVVAILAGLLESEDAKVRNFAAIALKDLGPNARSAVPALVKALESPDVIVRRWSADALGPFVESEARAVRPALMSALDDEDPRVRALAAAAFGPLGADAKAAIPRIVRLLWDHGPGDGVARALGQIGPAAAIAVPPLLASRNGANPPVREEIDAALNRIMPRDRGATLAGSVAALKSSDPDGRSRAACELGRLVEGPALSAGGAIVRGGALVASAALGEALGDPDPAVRRMAAAVLGRLETSAAVAGSALIGATRDPDDAVRRLAALALGRAVGEVSAAIPTLAGMMEEPSADVRRWVAGVLGSIGPRASAAAPALIAALVGSDVATRAAILTALGKLGPSDGSVLPALLKAMEDPAEDIRATAAIALGPFIATHRDAAILALLKALGDPADDVRYWAGQVLGYSKPHRLMFPHLVERLSHTDPVVRRSAASALTGMYNDPADEPEMPRRAAEALAGALADPDPRVRAAAAGALWPFGGAAEPAVPALRAALDDPSRRVRDQASATLRVIDADRAARR